MDYNTKPRYDENKQELHTDDKIKYKKVYKGHTLTIYGVIQDIYDDGKITVNPYEYEYFTDEYKSKKEFNEIIKKVVKPFTTLKSTMKVYKV